MNLENTPHKKEKKEVAFPEYIRLEADLVADYKKESGEDDIVWVNKYASEFERVAEAYPEILELYREDPLAAKERMKTELYKKEKPAQ